MSNTVQLPALGESVTEGTVTRWLKNVGDTIEVDEPLVEVSTDKVDTEIPSPFAGVIEKILVEEDETVEVGADLVVIGDGSGSSSDDAGTGEAPAPQEAPAEQPASGASPASPPPAAESAASESSGSQDAASGDDEGEEVRLPALGESVTEGTVTRWLKSVGDTVEADEPLLEVSTDKVDTEIPSPLAGTLRKILVEEDETVEVGAVLAVIGSGAAPSGSGSSQQAAQQTPTTAPAPAEPEQAQPAEVEPQRAQPAAVVDKAATGGDGRPTAPAPSAAPVASAAVPQTSYLTPLVRKLAAQKGVDLSTVTGTGVGGRIRKEDVLAAATTSSPSAPAGTAATGTPAKASTILPVSDLRGTTEKASRLRKIIGVRMVEALQSQAQLTTVVEVDVTALSRLRTANKDAFKAKHGANLTFLPFYAQAATEALQAYPKVNAFFDGETITYPAEENIGFAVDTERGLVVPVAKGGGGLGIVGFAQKIADLASRTRANKVTPDELSGATFTITNTGSGGALIDTPIVPVGTSAILGTGTIVRRPAVVKGPDGEDVIAIRSFAYLSLSYDHRLVDGADAARFLTAIKNRIEEAAFQADLQL